ncbi:cytochrome-c peroxidase [Pseudophaeobacter leonis]|uniref:cytochrome-c peroxidase n=1 Tax=Pseudophaeobacter leonis TaxID=1144477 RepID=UPI001F4DED38|nr:cytochrome c peroxidase [Pseudophaeobacter leonis]
MTCKLPGVLHLAVLAIVASAATVSCAEDKLSELQKLGEALFHDANLSMSRSQSCASCHEPSQGFADARRAADGAFSLGDDGRSLGNRNAPTAAYAAFVPPLQLHEDGVWRGGLFWDGRARDLEEQAAGPPLNPVEMALPNKQVVLQRLQKNEFYIQSFAALFSPDALRDEDQSFAAMTQAIAAYERSESFAPFDSKYDRYLAGKAELSAEEELGRVLFFSQQFTNCNQCQQFAKARWARRRPLAITAIIISGCREIRMLSAWQACPRAMSMRGFWLIQRFRTRRSGVNFARQRCAMWR